MVAGSIIPSARTQNALAHQAGRSRPGAGTRSLAQQVPRRVLVPERDAQRHHHVLRGVRVDSLRPRWRGLRRLDASDAEGKAIHFQILKPKSCGLLRNHHAPAGTNSLAPCAAWCCGLADAAKFAQTTSPQPPKSSSATRGSTGLRW